MPRVDRATVAFQTRSWWSGGDSILAYELMDAGSTPVEHGFFPLLFEASRPFLLSLPGSFRLIL